MMQSQRLLETESNETFFSPLKRFFLWIKQLVKAHPILTAAILAALIVAAVFSGGAALAAPAAFLIIAKVGALATGCVCFITLARNAQTPSNEEMEKV